MLIKIQLETKKGYKILVISQMNIPICFPIFYDVWSSFFIKAFGLRSARH